MDNRQHRRRLTNMNRGLIFALTVGGMLMDGPRLADLPCALALLVWLWLPLFIRLEALLLQRVGDRHGSAASVRASASP